MRVMRFVLASLGVMGLISVAALAQEGHPIKGSWLGDFGPNKTTRTQVFLVMDWDGKAISGMINPGTDNIPIKNAMLTPPTPPPPTAGGGRGGGGGAGQRALSRHVGMSSVRWRTLRRPATLNDFSPVPS